MTTSGEHELRTPTLLEAAAPVLFMTAALAVGYGAFGLRTELLLIASAAFTGAVARRLGLGWSQMQEGIVENVSKAMPALLIIITVGALIASWIVAGTIPMIVYYGLKIVSPAWFLPTSCLVCVVVSLISGTSWGTIGTVGIALIGIADGLGVSLSAAAGAIVAGAYFGDKLSPFSDTTNLAAIAARANLYDHIGHMLWTTTPALAVALVVYAIAGRAAAESISSPDIEALSTAIDGMFVLHPVLLLPPCITFYAAMRKKPVIPAMLLSVSVALALAIGLQSLDDRVLGPAGTYEQDHATWVRIAATLVTGPSPDTGSAALDRVVGRGGMLAMMGTTLIAICAFCFAGIAQRAGMLERLLGALATVTRSVGQLIAAALGSTLLMAMMTGNSYLSILVPGELFSGAFRERGLAARNLSRITEDAGTVIVPLIPWSIAAVFISGTLGVRTIDYAPWASSCYLGVLFSLLYGFTGISIAPRVRDDETQPGS